MKKNMVWTLVSSAILMVFVSSCNMFAPREDNVDFSYLDKYGAEAFVLEGKKKMWNKEWSEASKYFVEAIKRDSTKSEAWFYLGKTALRLADVDLNQVWDEIKPNGKADDANDVPFLYSAPSGKSITDNLTSNGGQFKKKIYAVTIDTTANGSVLGLVVDSSEFTATTLIDSVFIERKRIYDAMTQSMKFLEKIHSGAAMDGKIIREQYEPDYLVEAAVVAVLGIVDANKNGRLDWTPPNSRDVNERDAYRIVCTDIVSTDNMDFDSLKQLSKDPRDVKANLDLIIKSVAKADTSDSLFQLDLNVGAAKDPSLNGNMIESVSDMINQFVDILPFYYYDDFIDNDHDYWDTNRNGKVDRMIWIDWDGDGLIDIDSAGTRHIGDSSDIKANPSNYELIDTAGATFHRYKYKGGYSYEFIGGDWGVDEEIMDGDDNDQDGVTDEDTRIISDTLDDDGDGYNTDKSTLNQKSESSNQLMVWSNTSSELISVSGSQKDVAVSEEYTMLHAADYVRLGKTFPTTIKSYQGGYSGNFIGGDYGIDEEWYDGLDNDGDGLVDEDVGKDLPPESLRSYIIGKLSAAGLR